MITISAREIPDSRGRGTIEVEAGYKEWRVTASVPSGKSTGSREAVELRDPHGGVSGAVALINSEIRGMLAGAALDPMAIDAALRSLDGTENYKRLGANSVLAVSIAMRRLAALEMGIPLWQYVAKESNSIPAFPALYMNMINGGAHAGFNLPFQEHIAVITGLPSETYKQGEGIYYFLKAALEAKYGELSLGDEGGFAPKFEGGEREALDILSYATEDRNIRLALDAAASEFFKDGIYEFEGKNLSAQELGVMYLDMIEQYHLLSIEDPFSEFDEDSFPPFLSRVPEGVLVVGDDVTVTNRTRVEALSAKGAVNAMIVKPNQVGTLADVYQAVSEARSHGWKLIASHRSGETMDDFLADFAVGIGAFGMKAGAVSQPERRAKYERLVAIEEETGGNL